MPEKKNIKKLVLKSQYVDEEYDETKEMMDKYKEEFYKAFPEEYEKMLERQNQINNAIADNAEETDFDEQEIKEEHPQSENMKKIYRRITKITHPDKVESEFLTSYFKKASVAYGEHNISELFTIASLLNIDLSDIDSGDIASELEGSIMTKQFKTNNMKNSLAWGWAQAKTEEQKQQIKDQVADFIKKNY